jgi:Fe-S oxidoreductase
MKKIIELIKKLFGKGSVAEKAVQLNQLETEVKEEVAEVIEKVEVVVEKVKEKVKKQPKPKKETTTPSTRGRKKQVK